MVKVNINKNKEELIKENNFLRQRVAELEEFSQHNGRLNDIFSSLKDLVFVLDKDGAFTEFYVPSEEMYLPPEEFIDKKHSDVLPPHLNTLFSKALKKNKDGKIDEYEYSLEIAGKKQWYHAKQSPLFTKGQFAGSVAVIRNVTEYKQIKENLERESARFLKLLEYAPVGILELDYSAGMPSIDSLRNKGVANFNNYFNENPDAFLQFLGTAEIINHNRTSLEFYEEDIQADWDITKQIFNSLISNNITKEEEVDCKELIYIYSQLIDNQPGTLVRNIYKKTRKGKHKYIQQYYYAMPGHKDDLSWIIIVEVDITESMLANIELKKHQNHLEDLIKKRTSQLEESRLKEHKLYQSESALRQDLEDKIKQQVEFIRRLVHDLKTPLVPMLGTIDMMSSHIGEDKELKQMALNVQRGAKDLNYSINDLIDIMRGEIGILKLEHQRTNIAALIAEAVEFYKLEADGKKQILSLNIPEKLPVIWADSNRLKQVIMNLIENALRYTPSGGEIAVNITASETNITVEFIDSGIGIEEKDLPHLFEPYYSTEKGSVRSNGLGLGLPLAKMLVELHKGIIWAKNRPVRGAIIGFSIPVK